MRGLLGDGTQRHLALDRFAAIIPGDVAGGLAGAIEDQDDMFEGDRCEEPTDQRGGSGVR
jgi:hypothetical protein